MTLDIFGVDQLYPTVGREWFSTKWNNSIQRSLSECKVDPYDSNFEYSNGDPDDTKFIIKGNGQSYVSAKNTSHRFYVKGPWCNTEQTIYARFRNVARDIQLHSRSSHKLGGAFNIPDCKFSGYHVIWDRDKKTAMVECECLTSIIARGLISKPIPAIPLNKWIGFKQITRTLLSKDFVKVEGYMLTDVSTQNWAKSVEYIFDGTNTDFTVLHDRNDKYYNAYIACKNKGNPPAIDLIKYSAWVQPETMCWIRCNDADDIDFKFYSVREISTLP